MADTANLPHSAMITLGEEKLDLLVTGIMDGAGQVAALLLTWDVVTEKLANEESMQRLKQMVDGMPINVMLCDPDTFVVTYMNDMSLKALKSIEHLLPIRADEIVGPVLMCFTSSPPISAI